MSLDYIGQYIKSYRKANNLTLEALAVASGVSRAMISQIERGQKSPSIHTLAKLAKTMHIRLGDLVDPVRESQPILINSPSTDNLVSPANSPFECYQLTSGAGNKMVDFYRFTLKGFGQTDFDSNVEKTVKYLWLERGSLAIQFPDQQIGMESNQLIVFKASLPHRFVNKTGIQAKGSFTVINQL